MSKYHRINWRDTDTAELNRAVKNFNAKVNRLIKKNPQIKNMLPEKVQVAQLKELINTRQDLKREINALKRFSKRGAEQIVNIPDNDYNLKITKWQRTEMNRRVGIINRRRRERLEKVSETEMTSRGEPLGYTRAQIGMGRPELVELKPMNAFTRSMDRYSLAEKWKAILNYSQSDYFTRKDYQLRDNYIKGIIMHYDYENVKDIIEHIESMDIGEFLDVFYSEGGTFEIPSPPGGKDISGIAIKSASYDAYENALRSTWLPNKKV